MTLAGKRVDAYDSGWDEVKDNISCQDNIIGKFFGLSYWLEPHSSRDRSIHDDRGHNCCVPWPQFAYS